MKCPDLHNRLSAYQDRELAADKAQDIAKHLEVCDICRKEYKTLQIIDSLLNELPEITVSDAFHEKLKKTLIVSNTGLNRAPYSEPVAFYKNYNRIDIAFHPEEAIQPKRCPGRILRFAAKFNGQNIFYADLNTPNTRRQRFNNFGRE